MKKSPLGCLAVVLLLVISSGGHAAEVPAEAVVVMEAAGVPDYPGSVFCLGAAETGMRFAAGDDPQAVRAWYRENLPEWSLFHDEGLGIWTLYDGPAGITGFGKIMTFNNITIQTNEDLPGWYGLEPDMTTEIMMALPRVGPAEAGGPLLVIPGPAGRSDAAAVIAGGLNEAEDMQTGRGGSYYYLQDEQYMEHTIAFAEDLPEEIVSKLDIIVQTYETVRVKGVVIADENQGTSRFDPDWDIEIFVDQ